MLTQRWRPSPAGSAAVSYDSEASSCHDAGNSSQSVANSGWDPEYADSVIEDGEVPSDEAPAPSTETWDSDAGEHVEEAHSQAEDLSLIHI